MGWLGWEAGFQENIPVRVSAASAHQLPPHTGHLDDEEALRQASPRYLPHMEPSMAHDFILGLLFRKWRQGIREWPSRDPNTKYFTADSKNIRSLVKA